MDAESLEATGKVAASIIAIGGAAEVLRRYPGRWTLAAARACRAFFRKVQAHIDEQRYVNDVVMRELMPNSGSSLVDRVRAVEQFVSEQRAYIAERKRERARE